MGVTQNIELEDWQYPGYTQRLQISAVVPLKEHTEHLKKVVY